MKRPGILLADDHQMFAEMLRTLLSARYNVVGWETNGHSLIETARHLKPDVIVLDVGMPQLNGLDAGQQIKKIMPAVKLIFLTMNSDPYIIRRAFHIGASAFLLKQGAASELPAAIEKALRGSTYTTPAAAAALASIEQHLPSRESTPPEPTVRQREVIQLLAEGQSMKEVANTLNITARTVAAHKYAAMDNLGIKSSAELVQYALKSGMIYA